MKDVYKDLMLLEDEQEEQEKDIIFDELHSLTHLYKDDEDEGTVEVPWYCFLESVASDFGYDYQEMINLVKSSPDYIVFKIHPVGSFNGAVCIGAKGLDLDMVKEDIKKMCEDDFGDKNVEVKISLKESKLDDLKISSYKYLLDVYDRDDNFIERKFFRSRPEADKFVDAMNDLFDIKISNNEVVELKNGKDFFGTYWKVIRDLKKDESLDEDAKEVPWIMQQGENGELEYIGFAKSQNDMLNKLVKNHSSDVVKENTYINELDKDTYEYMKKDGDLSEDEIKELDRYFNIEESLEIKELKEELNNLGFEIALEESAHKDCQYLYRLITKEGNQTSDSFNDYVDRLEEAFENFRERTGYPCVFNVGLQDNGYICCNVEIKNESLEEDIEKHDTLNQKLFDDEELKPAVAKAIMNIANEFVKELGEDGISFTLKDVILLGSNMSYNYTKDSDLDIHLIADSSALECPKELQDKLYGAYRTIFNKNYDITIKGIPAEVYVEMDEPQAKSNGIYSLNSGWVKKPEQQDIPDLDKEAFDKAFKVWEDRYNDLVNNENATSEDVDQYINDIYAQRKEGIANEGEFSLGNLLFKETRNKGYLDNLKDLRKELKGKELSLEQLDNSTKEEYNNVEEKFMNKRYKKSIKEETKEDRIVDGVNITKLVNNLFVNHSKMMKKLGE